MFRSTHSAIAVALLGATVCTTMIGPAAAVPVIRVPLKEWPAGCEWVLRDKFRIDQDNEVYVDATGENGQAHHAEYRSYPGPRLITGKAWGGMNSDAVHFKMTVHWNETGGRNTYEGQIVGMYGDIDGKTVNERNLTNSFHISGGAACKPGTVTDGNLHWAGWF
ncbi:hypothetical protein ACJEIK_03670 [Mycobacterium sp. SMC-16]|uniref:hypothetical protein n=1 Tax=Mycobacterium sp. SMC-16 TaxID=3385967 RepID=UPI00390CC109